MVTPLVSPGDSPKSPVDPPTSPVDPPVSRVEDDAPYARRWFVRRLQSLRSTPPRGRKTQQMRKFNEDDSAKLFKGYSVVFSVDTQRIALILTLPRQLVRRIMLTATMQIRLLIKLMMYLLTLNEMMLLKTDLRDNQLHELSNSLNLLGSVPVNVALPREFTSIESLGDNTLDFPDVEMLESYTRKHSLSFSSDSGSVDLEEKSPASVDGTVDKPSVQVVEIDNDEDSPESDSLESPDIDHGRRDPRVRKTSVVDKILLRRPATQAGVSKAGVHVSLPAVERPALCKLYVAHGGSCRPWEKGKKQGLESSIDVKLCRLEKGKEGSKTFSINTLAQLDEERPIFSSQEMVLQGNVKEAGSTASELEKSTSEQGDCIKKKEARMSKKKTKKREREENENDDRKMFRAAFTGLETQQNDMNNFLNNLTRIQEQQLTVMNALVGALRTLLVQQ
ncbi:hypothetical protein ACROYT_G003921 [Oculina patagonica]